MQIWHQQSAPIMCVHSDPVCCSLHVVCAVFGSKQHVIDILEWHTPLDVSKTVQVALISNVL